MYNLTIAQNIATIISSIVAIISVLIALCALKQNSKIIREANKPYVVAYTDFIQVGGMRRNYLIIKNYGKSGAIIDSVSYSNQSFFENKEEPFKNLNKCSIAPNQTYSSTIFFSKPYTSFDITIKYHDTLGKYKDVFSLNIDAIANQLAGSTTNNTQTDLEKTISCTAQEILRKNL